MTKIQKVLREIENLRDFYKRTKSLRERIKKKAAARLENERRAEFPQQERSQMEEDTYGACRLT